MIKKFLIWVLIILCSVNLVGCDVDFSKIPRIPFEKFILQDTVSQKEIKLTKTDYIKLTELEQAEKNISELFDTICEKEYYYNNYYQLDKYYSEVKDLFSDEYYNNIILGKNEDLKKIADNIYYKENQIYKQSSIIEMGVENNNKYFTVDIIYLNDTQSFIIDEIKIYMNNSSKIIKTELLSEMNSVVNTTKNISLKDSLLDDDELNNFSKILLTFLNNMKNKELYNMVIEDNNELQLSTLIENINLENKNNEVLKNLFIVGKGEFNDYEITDYYLNDKDGLANSYYIASFVNKDTITKFIFNYSRITKEIISIEQI